MSSIAPLPQRPNVNDKWCEVSTEFLRRCMHGEDPDAVIKDLQTRYSGLGPVNQASLKKLLEPMNPPAPVINKYFAPYAECWNYWSGWNGAKTLDKIPTKNVTIAFVLSSNGTPKFDGTMDINTFVSQAKAVQVKGGIVRISFGGATGTELAIDIKDVNKLVEAYDSVITMYNTRNIDMDIEGAAASDTASIIRRNKALAILQKKYPDLKVDYTLSCMQRGLESQGLNILKNAKDQGVKLNAVNIMAMCYGSGETQMGKAVISAANATKKQCDDLGFVYGGIGITPQIGKNDTPNETFTIDNAKEVMAFVQKTTWIIFTAFWAVGLDNAKSSKTPQEQWEFTNIFNATNA
jgi:hypothetical protein